MRLLVQIQDATYRTRGGGPIIATGHSTVFLAGVGRGPRIRCTICDRASIQAVLGTTCPGCGAVVVAVAEETPNTAAPREPGMDDD